nr:glycosyltransferase [Thaumasiovibrio subtropicus]
MGPAHSRNVGIKLAKSDYIAFLDSDDDWHPQKIHCQILLMKELGADVSGTQHAVVSKAEFMQFSQTRVLSSNIDVVPITWPRVLFKSPFSTPSVVMRNGLGMYFDETLRFSEDFNLWIRLSKEFKVIRLDEPLTYTFKHDYLSTGGSLSSNLSAMQKGELANFFSLLAGRSLSFYERCTLLAAIVFSCFKFIRRLLLSIILKAKVWVKC